MLSEACHHISLGILFISLRVVENEPEQWKKIVEAEEIQSVTRLEYCTPIYWIPLTHGKTYSTLMTPMSNGPLLETTGSPLLQLPAPTHASFLPSARLWRTVTSSVIVQGSLSLPQEARRRLQIAVGVEYRSDPPQTIFHKAWIG